MVLTPDLEHLIEQRVEQRLERRVQAQVIELVELLAIRPITEAIALRVEAIEGFKHLEIVAGDWVGLGKDDPFMGGEKHGWIESILIHLLMTWALSTKAGRVYSGDTIFVLDGEPGYIRLRRQPDVAFVAADRVQPTTGYVYGAPDLAVEIISPSERPDDIQKKLREYLQHGVRMVWQVYPESREIVVHLPDSTARTYQMGEVIAGGDVLPGLELSVTEVFA
jgi:Uma2 family endonuclease